ncbi:MAG: inorganic phosphate transporter [Candidatus Margulisbacteria bacterium]|nr:inorganic phosphate transporter [Candidatus Margulisiibacteriota bacterium]
MIFFALNMGGSGIAPSFASVYGAGLISREKAAALFAVFVVLGALVLGSRVAKTLSSGLLPAHLFTLQVALIILGSAAISLFIANVLKVPQSTSWVTVFAVFGAALHFNSLNPAATLQMVSLWLVLPLIGFFLTFLFFRSIYPPRAANFWFYEKAHAWKKPIQYLAVVSSCYVAFAIGANNVANAVGPLAGAGLIQPGLGLLLISPLFGLGGWAIKERTMRTIGREIVPLGLVASTIVAFITASLLIFASALGFPQSLVQLNALAIMAVGTIKHEHVLAAREEAVRKMFAVWLVAPLLAGLLSFLALSLWRV